jgi:ribosomal protein L37AE/L43A
MHAQSPKKARKVGRPRMPKGEAMGKIVPVRFTREDMQALALVTAATNQTISVWVRSVVRRSFRWIVECKDCGKEFVFRLIDEGHPRESVNNMPNVEPPKPALRNLAEERTCPHCNQTATYKRVDLEFRAN